jgi:hypothetical protein
MFDLFLVNSCNKHFKNENKIESYPINIANYKHISDYKNENIYCCNAKFPQWKSKNYESVRK